VSVGLVYLRPLRLVGITAPRVSDVAICESWNVLNDWITRKSLSSEIEIGYGLLQHSALGEGDGVPSYEACIETPMSVTPSETSELKQFRLQGGAYFRRRYQGPVASMLTELRTMRTELGNSGHVKIDLGRPIVTVILDVRKLRFGDEVRSNLLIPARGCDMFGSSRCAA
jgi:hypothetical protein